MQAVTDLPLLHQFGSAAEDWNACHSMSTAVEHPKSSRTGHVAPHCGNLVTTVGKMPDLRTAGSRTQTCHLRWAHAVKDSAARETAPDSPDLMTARSLRYLRMRRYPKACSRPWAAVGRAISGTKRTKRCETICECLWRRRWLGLVAAAAAEVGGRALPTTFRISGVRCCNDSNLGNLKAFGS